MNKNHFNYLEIQNEENSDIKTQQELISKCINNNLLEWKNIRKQEYPLSLKGILKYTEKCIVFKI